MDINEFRNAMASDASIENERLKQDLADIMKKYDDMCEAYTERIQMLTDDYRGLANRCFVSTHGKLCSFCALDGYDCPHAVSFDEKNRNHKGTYEYKFFSKLFI